MKTTFIRLFLLSQFLIKIAFTQSILVIGDSHTAGPFGQNLHQGLTHYFHQVITLGHSSSSAFHWIDLSEHKLSGGIFQKAYKAGQSASHPNPPHWRTKVPVPKFTHVLKDHAVHDHWTMKLGPLAQADVLVIALGANDANVIADSNSRVRRNSYIKRAEAINTMINLAKSHNMQCIWIGPPEGIKISNKNLDTLYIMLEEIIKPRCLLLSSRHYRSEGCDGIHFSCQSQRPKAIRWADEVLDFIIEQTN